MKSRLLPRSFRCSLGVALVASAPLAGCATNPATGEKQLSLIGERQEIELGRQASREVALTIGLYDDARLQSYVERIGDSLAVLSERPKLPWSFGVADDPSVNAFALPGGFIYVTRGILAHLNSEAELAGVLGHEIGHVTARHAVERMSTAQLANLGLGIGSILSPEVARYSDLANVGLGLLFLKYSRDDERQADELGLRYAIRGGYDPRPMTAVFSTLERVSKLQEGGRLPNWLSSHPSPENRRELVAKQIAATNVNFNYAVVQREQYLRQIDGVIFGPNPREGFFRESVFFHPDQRFRLEFPRGWKAVNQKTQVFAISPRQDAIVGLALAQESSAKAAARKFAGQQGIRTGSFRSGSINGTAALSTSFEARTQQGTLLGVVAFLDYQGRVFQLLGYAPSRMWRTYEREITQTISSFDKLTDPRILEIEPQRIDVVELPSAITLQQFVARFPSPVPLETLALLNQAEPGETLQAGRLVKRVVGEGAR
jgi:predicted Zn-dependent protease